MFADGDAETAETSVQAGHVLQNGKKMEAFFKQQKIKSLQIC
jgi:hypothetical protein